MTSGWKSGSVRDGIGLVGGPPALRERRVWEMNWTLDRWLTMDNVDAIQMTGWVTYFELQELECENSRPARGNGKFLHLYGSGARHS